MPNYNATANLNAKPFMAGLAQMTAGVQAFAATTQSSMSQVSTAMDRNTDMMRRNAMETAKMRLSMSRTERSIKGFLGEVQRAPKAMKAMKSSMDWMPTHSAATEKALLRMGSASQGVMLGMGLLQGSVQSVGFSLIFLRWGILSVAIAAAALTVALGVGIGILTSWIGFVKKATAAGKEFEKALQQISSYFQSKDIAMAIEQQADQFSRMYGIARTDARQAFVELQKIGLAQQGYAKAFGNIAKATGQDVGSVAAEFVSAFQSGGDAVQDFANKYDLGISNITSASQVATAANERFKNSLEDWAQTAAGMQARLGASWSSFLIQAGRIFNEIFKTVFGPMIALVEGLISGFKKAEESSKSSGELAKVLNDVASAAKKLMPYLFQLGEFLGRVIFRSAIWAAKGMKVFYDAIRAGLKWLKANKDQFITFGQTFKQNFLTVFTGASFPVSFFSGFIAGFVGGLVKAFTGAELDEVPKGVMKGLSRAFREIPSSFLDGIWRGLKQGIILGLIEAVALTVTDMLPISQAAKDTLYGVIYFGFMGANLGLMFGPLGGLIGAALGAAFGAGIDLFGGSGTARKWADTLDRVMLEGLKKIPEVVQTAWTKAQEFADWLTGDGTGALEGFEGQVIDDNTAWNAWSQDMANKHEPIIKQAVDSVRNVGTDLYNFSKNELFPHMKDIWQFIDGPLMDVWTSIKNLWQGPVKEAATQVWVILDQLWQIIKKVWDWLVILDDKFGIVNKTLEVLEFFIKITLLETLRALEFMFNAIGDLIQRFVVPMLELIANTLRILVALINGDWTGAWNAFQALLINLMEIALAPFLFALDTLKNFSDLSGLTNAFRDVYNFLYDHLLWVIKEVSSWIDNVAGKVGKLNPSNWGFNVPGFQHGGVVPGRPGQRTLVMAEAGERFLGSGTFAKGAFGPNARTGMGSVQIDVHITDTVITSELAMRELAGQILSLAFRDMRVGRVMTGIRVG